ncbi:PREDICTED: kinesin-like protein KIN-12F [Ipomoea nil]|uniref:kinesin-like protein KIN-12F n=1 Tax=Ipomoea nil TaxID=35883 RepID=UPI000901C0F0|nr:PREDICTED: kinesin-like protein KIN-12F [Ipomoea nil]
MSENRFLGSISNSTIRSLLPKSISSKSRMSLTRSKSRFNGENIAPMDPNVQISDPPLFSSNSIPKKAQSKQATPIKELAKSEAKVEVSKAPDPSVKVVVRIRPGNGLTTGDRMVRGVSKDSVSVGDKKFTFDSIFDSNSTQEDVFQSVGIPLVKDALAGYNTSLLAYGQTGSGKTYTLWGPPSAMVETPSTNGLQGIVPRIFEMLFDNIQREHENSEDKQISYQCRCSFLEVYNGHIGDLLDPMQRNLKIKDDTKNGFYVENLTEEYVSTYEDVTQVLIKGLSSRKVGSTGVNSKSSRSHVVFTCIIESWCKENSSKCFGSSKTSRITIVDLAGFERNILEDAGRQCIKEGKFVKKSTSQLGRLVNILSEQSQRVLEVVPYSCSSLTHLLRESLGGNAKLSVICTISQTDKHASDTISTLRFGKKVKLMKNEPVINEITEDDVNGLSDQIRLLKEELIRAKSSVNNVSGINSGYFKGHNMRESLNQLRVSLNRSLMLPRIDNDSEEEVHINEDDIKELQVQIDSYSHEENSKETIENKNCSKFCSAEGSVTDVMSEEHYISCSEEEGEIEELDSEVFQSELLHINTNLQCTVLQDPVLSESPKFGNTQRKSLVISSSPSLNETDKQDNSRCSALPEKENNIVQSSLRSSRIFPGPTESLAASLHRGLQIIDHHQQNSASIMRSSIASFSFDHFAMKSSVDKVKTIQTSSEGQQTSETWIVPVDGTNGHRKADQVPKEYEKDLTEALEREKNLESVCKEQAEKIQQLSQLLAQCKCETQNNVLIGCEDMDRKKWRESINFKEKHLLEWNGNRDCEQEIVKEIQGEVDHNDSGKTFDMAERDALLTEIENLKSKLQPTNKSTERARSSLLLQSIQLGKSGAYAKGANEEELEAERQRWTEMESEWISLTDELRIDLESIRQRAEKVEMELKLEKNCTEELDDALQRSVLGHARMVEHYAELQEKYNDLAEKHRLIMQGIQDVKKAAAKAGAKGHGARFAKSLAAELSALRVEREKERDLLKKENKSLKAQLRDTAEAVHAAGELLVRLRESEETASVTEEKFTAAREENEKLRKQMEKLKRKHKMEMITMKQYLAESRLPEAALRPLYREDSDIPPQNDTTTSHSPVYDDDQAWRAEFGAIYQDHHY